MTIADIMKRKSVRNYTDEPVKPEDLDKLRGFIEEVNKSRSVFGSQVRLQYLESGGDGGKLGTYGVISGARAFLSVVCKKGVHNLEDAGYQFEKLILYATGLGLGTVILGGTFSRGGFAKAVNLQADEALPVVSPVGYEGGKKSLLGRVIKSHNRDRKPWGELFFEGNAATPLKEAGEYKEVLEAVRQAPSTMNAQPWRVVKDGGAFHFYSAGRLDLNRIDMGIALCHFEIAAKEKGLADGFSVMERSVEGDWKYLVSCRRNN
jgi:nitroreductase